MEPFSKQNPRKEKESHRAKLGWNMKSAAVPILSVPQDKKLQQGAGLMVADKPPASFMQNACHAVCVILSDGPICSYGGCGPLVFRKNTSNRTQREFCQRQIWSVGRSELT